MLAGHSRVALDTYVVDVLMRDLVAHDRSTSAFLVYLVLWRRRRGSTMGSGVRMSHRDIAEESGLSKSAVQSGLRVLHRRGLVRSRRERPTAVPEHTVVRTWVRGR